MLALENPHCGVSGVPFINSTTGADATALSIACLVSEDRYRKAMGEIRGTANLEAIVGAGRAACRNAFIASVHVLSYSPLFWKLTDDKIGLASIFADILSRMPV